MQAVKASLTGNLVRKQFLISNNQLVKLSSLSASKGKSEAEIVRLAIDAYNPDDINTDTVPELMELLDQRLKDALQSTRRASKVVAKTLKQLEV